MTYEQQRAVDYLTVPDIARDAGVSITTVHNWLKYHHHMQWTRILGRPVVHRTEYARFVRDHSELVPASTLATVPLAGRSSDDGGWED